MTHRSMSKGYDSCKATAEGSVTVCEARQPLISPVLDFGQWHLLQFQLHVESWVIFKYVDWFLADFIYGFNMFQHFQHDICFVSCISCVMTGVEHLDIFDLGIAWKGYPKAAASWRWQDIPIRSRNTKKPHKIIQFHMGCMMLFVCCLGPLKNKLGDLG